METMSLPRANPDPPIRRLYWTPEAEGLPALERARSLLPGVSGGLVPGPEALPPEDLNIRTIS